MSPPMVIHCVSLLQVLYLIPLNFVFPLSSSKKKKSEAPPYKLLWLYSYFLPIFVYFKMKFLAHLETNLAYWLIGYFCACHVNLEQAVKWKCSMF